MALGEIMEDAMWYSGVKKPECFTQSLTTIAYIAIAKLPTTPPNIPTLIADPMEVLLLFNAVATKTPLDSLLPQMRTL